MFDFKRHVWGIGFHIEEGGIVPKCTRGKEKDEELQESEKEEVEPNTYKVALNEGESEFVWLKALPKDTMDLLDSKNSVTVESNNEKICKATYNKTNKLIIVEAIGEGSTEIVIHAKKGILWWKKTCDQKVSVTVNALPEDKQTNTTYYVVSPAKLGIWV